MICGARYWNDRDNYYIQTNNPTEEILRKNLVKVNQLIKELDDDRIIGFLESCGSTTAVNCLAVHGYYLDILCPGPYRPQPEEVLNDWFNDPRNYKLLEKVRADIGPQDLPGNRVPQYYPPAMMDVFGVKCEFVWIATHHQLADRFKEGCSIQLCLKSPSHYVAGVAFDMATSEIILNDPWPGRFPDGNGFNRRMDINEFKRNVENFAIIYAGAKK